MHIITAKANIKFQIIKDFLVKKFKFQYLKLLTTLSHFNSLKFFAKT